MWMVATKIGNELMDRIRVLLTNFHRYGQGGGGHTSYLKTLTKLNNQDRFEIGAAVPPTSITFKQLGTAGLPNLFPCDFATKLTEIRGVIKSICQFRRIVKEFTPHIVHANGGADLAIAHWSYPKRKPFRLIRTHHSIKGLGRDFYHRHLYNKVVNHNIYVSDSAFEISTKLGLRPPRCSVIKHGVDLNHFHPLDKDKDLLTKYNLNGRFVFGSCAGLADCKRVDLMIQAAGRIRNEYKFAIIVVGNEFYGRKLQRMADEMRVPEFIYCGATEDVRPFISLIDAGFILSDSAETISFAAREMLAMGKPLISSSFSGLKENVQEGFNGLLTKPGSLDETEAAMRRFLSIPKSQLTEYSSNARRFAIENCDVAENLNRYAELYNEIRQVRR
jgi:glycosyltransferase involved in cell wall biosynthesis